MTTAGSILLASIPILISLYEAKYREMDKEVVFKNNPVDLNLPMGETFDFIIVGCGNAGSVLANRLSEKYLVLCLEAGGDPPPISTVPMIQRPVSFAPGINFLYRSTPHKNAALEHDGVDLIPAGKMLGGSGEHNHMVWERGSPHDYDRWAEVTKDGSWRYKKILKYFKKIEQYHGIFKENGHHGLTGHLGVNESSFAPGGDLWLAAGQELGYQIRDHNGPQTVGFSRVQSTRLNGHRSSTYTAYLKPILRERRRRLKVYKYSLVSRVLFDKKTAIGVEYTRHGVARSAFASKEVILSAGAFISPIILFKSGIGPEDQVKAAKAQRHIVNLPVGHNLMDHPRVDINDIKVNDPSLTWSVDRNLTFDDVDDFLKHGTGPLTSSLVQVEALINTERLSNHNKVDSTLDSTSIGDYVWPNMQISFKTIAIPTPHFVGGIIILGLPKSVGILKINESATSMEDDYLPLLNYNYFDVETDMDQMIKGINFFLKIMEKTKTFKKVGAQLSNEHYEPCKSHEFRSKDYWKCFLRHKTTSGYHSCGTCRMGHKEDPMAVVDSKLRVIGVKRLRVVDASIFPFITDANIVAPTTLVAEKAAHVILKKYEKNV